MADLQMTPVWVVNASDGYNESFVAVFLSQSEAETYAAKHGGGYYRVVQKSAHVYDKKAYFIESVRTLDETPEVLKARKRMALSKLTLEERSLLGLEEVK